jgi:C-terminal processing protease CtpA/Prc
MLKKSLNTGIKAGRLKINDVIVSIDSLPVAGLKLAQIEKAMVRYSETSCPTLAPPPLLCI